MSTFAIVAVAAILLIAIPAGMMSRRIHKRTEDHDPEARQAALDFQRDVDIIRPMLISGTAFLRLRTNR